MHLQKDTPFSTSRVRRSENIPPIFLFSGILDQSFASEIPPSPRNQIAHATPKFLSTPRIKGGHCLYPISQSTPYIGHASSKRYPPFSFSRGFYTRVLLQKYSPFPEKIGMPTRLLKNLRGAGDDDDV
jgi:hypothetical protein